MYNIHNKIIFSAIQPTGNLTLGHYLGILKIWKMMQKNNHCFYCIADYHAITSIYSNKLNVNLNIFNFLSLFLSSGIQNDKCVIFLQSDIGVHLDLYWILSSYTYMGELKRMTQFKDKRSLFKNNISIFIYPVLMASDILIYDSDLVIIGEDQIQHIELVKVIAKRFNDVNNTGILNIPDYLMDKNCSKVMSLINVDKKMSKSDLNSNNVIFLLDKIDLIRKKILKSVTDCDNPSKIIYDTKNKKGISNLISILSAIENVPIYVLEKRFVNSNYKEFKLYVSDKVCEIIKEIQEKYYYFINKKKYLNDILFNGKIEAQKVANYKINKIFNILNFK